MIDFNLSTADFSSNPNVQDLLDELNSGDVFSDQGARDLPSDQDAQDHLEDTLDAIWQNLIPFVGTWVGEYTLTSDSDEDVYGDAVLTVNYDGTGMIEFNSMTTADSYEILSFTVNNGVLNFDMPTDTPELPDCLNWDMPATLSSDGTFQVIGTICGSGGGQAGTITATLTFYGFGDSDGDDPGGDPAYSGYDFTLQEGSFWEFGFRDYSRSWYLGDSNTSTDTGTFRITLGATIVINGITAYPLSVVAVSGDDIADAMTLRWDYIALHQGRILGSTNGTSLSIIFDGVLGAQAGGGFFANFSSSDLIRAASGQIDNDYITESATYLSQASSSGGCEYFPGVGTICPPYDREGLTVRDFFQPGIGPVGYYWHSYNTDSQGNSGAVIQLDIGLISFSVEGDGLYDPPDVPELSSGTVAVYYSLYDSEPSLTIDPFNAPTATDPAKVLMRYLPDTETGATLTATVGESSDYGYHAMTEGDRLFILKRTTTASSVQAVEYNPGTHSPLANTTTTINNVSSSLHYGAFTAVGNRMYFHKFNHHLLKPSAKLMVQALLCG